MIEFDQFKYELSTKAEPLEHLGASLDLENKRKRILELDRMMDGPREGEPSLHGKSSSEKRAGELSESEAKL